MAETATFSSSGVDAITRSIDLTEEVQGTLPLDVLERTYDIERTANHISLGAYKRVALQFPDELLPHSVPIFKALKSRIPEASELYVLADTSYGSCCVDEVAAQHVDADALVHYGHACMSQTSRLPVIYVFGKKPIDPLHCAQTLVAALPDDRQTVVLKCDVAYTHAAHEIVTHMKSVLSPSTRVLYTIAPLATFPSTVDQAPRQSPHAVQVTGQGESESLDSDMSPEDSVILHVGPESLSLTNLLLTHAAFEVFSYHPTTRSAQHESGRTNKLLMRRYAAVQKARDADVIGILVGTLGVANYLPLISHLRNVISRAHKKSYTISVGKPNPAKLANFLEIECFVLVACPENSLLDAKEFLRPIVTPYELEAALQPTQTWTGRYVLDFAELLKSQADMKEAESKYLGNEPQDSDQPIFSLVTGKYRHAKRYGDSDEARAAEGDPSAIVLRNQEDALSRINGSAASQFLQQRTFRGLETRIGQDGPSLLEQGRSGIARGYDNDHREG
ncbi:diphthamide biosynthesis protein [Epithele typhae]|uniref:diphthamide biosynthesis protein n=1 Tax=Epithele typhae TaxID=378194 RepID=UPI0020087ED2|nr:diphthamide biosynthesis protein [Epithele typhae]KAH9933986.1 diphthamide biosynthesis protein [Epithele typhae]